MFTFISWIELHLKVSTDFYWTGYSRYSKVILKNPWTPSVNTNVKSSRSDFFQHFLERAPFFVVFFTLGRTILKLVSSGNLRHLTFGSWVYHDDSTPKRRDGLVYWNKSCKHSAKIADMQDQHLREVYTRFFLFCFCQVITRALIARGVSQYHRVQIISNHGCFDFRGKVRGSTPEKDFLVRPRCQTNRDVMPRVTLSGNTVISGTKTFTTGTGAVSLNGATTVADSKLAFSFNGLWDEVVSQFFPCPIEDPEKASNFKQAMLQLFQVGGVLGAHVSGKITGLLSLWVRPALVEQAFCTALSPLEGQAGQDAGPLRLLVLQLRGRWW